MTLEAAVARKSTQVSELRREREDLFDKWHDAAFKLRSKENVYRHACEKQHMFFCMLRSAREEARDQACRRLMAVEKCECGLAVYDEPVVPGAFRGRATEEIERKLGRVRASLPQDAYHYRWARVRSDQCNGTMACTWHGMKGSFRF